MSLGQGVTRGRLRETVAAALQQAGTIAGQNVFNQRAWSLRPNQYPAILVSTPLEKKEALSASLATAPTFDASISIACSLRTAANPAKDGTSAADADLEMLCEQVENVMLATLAVLDVVQNITSVDTQFSTSAEGSPILGEASVIFTVVVRQQYWPDNALPLVGIQAMRPNQNGVETPLFNAPLAQS